MMKQKTKTGHEVEDISEELFKRLRKHFPNYDGYVRLQPGNWLCFSTLPRILDKICDLTFKPTDTIVITYPKSGTTWMQEIVWTLQNNPDLNNPLASMSIDMRSLHLELDTLLTFKSFIGFEEDSAVVKFLTKNAPHILKEEDKIFSIVEWMKGTRVIKSHLALDLFPRNAMETSKIIYLARDPRDVIVSKYHYFRVSKIHSFQGTLEEFTNLMLNEEQIHHPFWEHLKGGYDLRDHPNLLFLYFEDLKEDPFKVIKQISEFLGLQRTPEQIKNVVEFTDFKNMKKLADEGKIDQPMSDGGRLFNKDLEEYKDGKPFFRKGTSGSWSDSFTDEQVKKINEWIEKNLKMFPDDFKYKV